MYSLDTYCLQLSMSLLKPHSGATRLVFVPDRRACLAVQLSEDRNHPPPHSFASNLCVTSSNFHLNSLCLTAVRSARQSEYEHQSMQFSKISRVRSVLLVIRWNKLSPFTLLFTCFAAKHSGIPMDLLDLPYDISEDVFSCLDALSLHQLRRVCSAWNELVLNFTALRRIVVFHCRLTAATLWGFGSPWKSVPLALAACVVCETQILVLRIEIQHLTTDQALQLCNQPFRQDWICALFFDKESYVNAKSLHTIIFQGNGKYYWEREFHTHLRIDLLPSALPVSVQRVMLYNISLETVSHDDQVHLFATLNGIARKKVLYKTGSVWPWSCEMGYERVKALASWFGDINGEMEKLFEENLRSYPDPDGIIQKELQWYETRFGDAQLAKSFSQIDLATLRRCQPWIQHLIHSRVAKTAYHYKRGLALVLD